MAISYTYIDAIGKGYPGIGCRCTGDDSAYESIIPVEGTTLPSQAELDTWIVNQIKLDMWDLIKEERDRRKSSGGYKVGTHWYHSDDTSRIQQLALVMLGSNIPNGLLWKTLSGEFVSMTPTLALQIFQSAISSDMSIFTVAEQKKAVMQSSNDPANYDYLSGWPLMFGE